MTVRGWIVFGSIVGIVAKVPMPGRDPGAFLTAVTGSILLLWIYRRTASTTAT